ncbi:MAG: hypothetical protein LBI31_01100 [Zoogloeaceae bacterium]|nr:hypothetical protein [Zoogloeaceae bacterium]
MFVQAADDAIYITLQNGERFKTQRERLPPSLSVEALLEMQDIRWVYSAKKRQALEELCEEVGFPFPRFSFDKAILYDVEINNVHFDAVWNTGDNRLRFLIIRRDSLRDDNISRLAEARNILDLALGRKRFKNLLDRDITVIDEDKTTIERLKEEGRGKVKPIHLSKSLYSKKKIVSALRDAFKPYKPSGVQPPLPDKPAFSGFSGSTLATALGRTPLLTLLVMGAHRAREVILCASPGNEEIKAAAEVLREQAKSYGLGRVQVLATNPQGTELPDMLPKIDQPCAVNITPGTKAQGAFLTQWAKAGGHEIWAVDRGAGRMLNLLEPTQSRELPKPPLRLLLDCLAPGCVASYGLSARAPGWDARDGFYDAMLRFLHELSVADRWKEFAKLFQRKLSCLKAGSLRFDWIDQETFKLIDSAADRRSVHKCGLKGGKWFEKLTAVALARLEEEYDPVVNVKIKWKNPNVGKPLDKLRKPHRTELDVVLSAPGGKLYVISCKTSRLDKKSLANAAREVRACAKTLNRFAVPLLHSLHARGRRELEGIMLFGPDTLCQPDDLRRCLEEAEALPFLEAPTGSS